MGTFSRINHTISILLTSSVLLFGCGGPGAGNGANPPDPGDPAADGGTTETGFCSGDAAKFEWSGGLIAPAGVTSSRLSQSGCCDGAILRFHVDNDVGLRPSIMFRRTSGAAIAGEFDLRDRVSGIDVTLYVGDTPINAVFTGTAQFESNRSQPGPVLARVCATIYAPNSPLDGARFYARSFPVMPWSWDDRLTIKLLANHSLNAQEASSMPFADLKTDPNPLVHVSSYSSYEQGTHAAHWDSWSRTDLIRARVGTVGPLGVPFVMEADGVPVYLGSFVGAASGSQPFPGPRIDIDKMNNDGFRIDFGASPGHPDPRADGRVLKVLRESGKLLP